MAVQRGLGETSETQRTTIARIPGVVRRRLKVAGRLSRMIVPTSEEGCDPVGSPPRRRRDSYSPYDGPS